MAQYVEPVSQADFQNSINNTELSDITKNKILDLVTGADVNVQEWDGSADLGNTLYDSLIVKPVAGGSGQTVNIVLPADQLASVKAWIFDTDANISANFNTIDRVIVGGRGENTFVVAGDHDTTIVGGDKADSFTTSAGNDRIEAGAGNTEVDLGEGFDVLVLKGDAENYSVQIVDGALVVNNKIGTAVTVVGGTGVNFIEFSNTEGGNVENVKSIAILGSEEAGTVVRLYDGLLNRNAEGNGAQFWVQAEEAGFSLTTIADAFIKTAEFQTAHGSLEDRAFVELLYTQALERTDGGAADTTGIDFWTTALEQGFTRGQIAVAIVGSDEAAEATADHIKIVDGWV